MEITAIEEQGRVPVTVLHLKGNLNWEEPLLSEARKAFEAGARHILLDLSDVPFMSSAGLRAVHEIFDLLRRAGPTISDEEVARGITANTYKSSHLKLLKPSQNARRALSVAGFDMFLEIHDHRKAAVDSF